MPTILTHAALPLIAAWAAGPQHVPRKLALAGAIIAVIPDLDVAGRAFGISSESLLGHRGISHSFAEDTREDDLVLGVQVLAHAVARIVSRPNP